MNTRNAIPLFSSLILSATLILAAGCGGGSGGGGAAQSGEAQQLEAKVLQQGDADAAMKLGEYYANKGTDTKTRIQAAKWFSVAGLLGNSNAKMALDTVTKGMSLEDQGEAERQALAVKLPKKN
jgi:TPR repeat protein